MELDCFLGATGNIFRPDCPFVPGVEIGGIIGPRSMVFAAGDTADSDAFRDALEAAAAADESNERIFIVGRYQDNAPSGEAAQDQTFASGLKVRTREATMQDTMTLVEDKIYHTAVKQTLHNKQARFGYLKVLDQGAGKYAVIGRKTRDGSGNIVQGFLGLNVLQVSDYIYPTPSTRGTFTLDRGFSSPSDVDNNYTVILLDFNPLDEINGLKTVDLFATSTGPTNVTVTGTLSSGTTDLRGLFGADLAVVGAWKAFNDELGDANYGDEITIASVALSGTKAYALTLAATGVDPDNPGTGKRVRVKLTVPSALAALTPAVEGIESDEATVLLG